MKNLKNTAASVRQRLLNLSRTGELSFQELLQYYGMERFLYRLSVSLHRNSFILKGALMFRVWRADQARTTMDIDMLGRTSNREDDIVAHIKDIVSTDVIEDGIVFDGNSISTEQITENATYIGLRVLITGYLERARIRIQIDVGFGDKVYPEPTSMEIPTILDLPAPSLFCYSKETSIAEKFDAMVTLGELNSRMKDFYDIWLLCRQFEFESKILARAIVHTIGARDTELTNNIAAFSLSFANMKQVQWAAFHKKLRRSDVPADFVAIVETVRNFLEPIVTQIQTPKKTVSYWLKGGPWRSEKEFHVT